jgi:beta-galactosidase/beta-glucuronidase
MARTLFKVNSPLFIILFFAFAPKDPVFSQTIQDFNYRKKIDLKGEWQFALDQNNQGLNEKWYQRDLNEKVQLPGTTDLNKKGILNKDSSTMHLSRVYHYEGAAWYRKKVVIPSEFRNKHIALFLERTKSSKVWIDDQPVGGSFLLQSPQRFDVSSYRHVVFRNQLIMNIYAK